MDIAPASEQEEEHDRIDRKIRVDKGRAVSWKAHENSGKIHCVRSLPPFCTLGVYPEGLAGAEDTCRRVWKKVRGHKIEHDDSQ